MRCGILLAVLLFGVGCSAHKRVAPIVLVGVHCDKNNPLNCSCEVIDRQLNAKTKQEELVCR